MSSSASRANHSAAITIAIAAIVRTVCSSRRVKSRSVSTNHFTADCHPLKHCARSPQSNKMQPRNHEATKKKLRKIVRGEVAHELVNLAQFLERRQEHDPHEPLFRRQSESGPVDAQHAGRV